MATGHRPLVSLWIVLGLVCPSPVSVSSALYGTRLLLGLTLGLILGRGAVLWYPFGIVPTFLDIISKIDPARIKFGDEKHLKGDAIFNRKVRRNPITGEVPEMIVTSDFRNRYNLTGFCSINPMTTKYAVWCSLHECINDADQFHLELEYAIHSGFFRGGDVLVLDNAAVHTGKENSVLQDYLWEKYAIFLLFLPARAPEWNPMEQVWTSLVQRLRELPVNKCREVAKETGPHLSTYPNSFLRVPIAGTHHTLSTSPRRKIEGPNVLTVAYVKRVHRVPGQIV